MNLIQRANLVIAEFKNDFAKASTTAEQIASVSDFETLMSHNKPLAPFVDLVLEEYKSMLPTVK